MQIGAVPLKNCICLPSFNTKNNLARVHIMASIQKLKRAKGFIYKVTIRRAGHSAICKNFKTKKEALAYSRKVEGDDNLISTLGNSVAKGLTLNQVIDEFMEQYSGKDSGLQGKLNWWSAEYGHLSLNLINALVVRDGLKKLSEGKVRRSDGGRKGRVIEVAKQRSGSTVNRYKAALSSIFEYSKAEYGLTENPCRQIRAKPENAGRTRFLTDLERSALLTACQSSEWDKLYPLVLMALTTGARKGELLGLQWSDINFTARLATLHETKNGTQRLLPLTNDVISELQAFRGIGNNLLFPSRVNPQKPFEFRKLWIKALDDAEIKDFRFHDLRHSAASFLAMNGASLQEIAEVLGHKSIQVTMRYSHLCIDHKQRLIDSVMGGIK